MTPSPFEVRIMEKYRGALARLNEATLMLSDTGLCTTTVTKRKYLNDIRRACDELEDLYAAAE